MTSREKILARVKSNQPSDLPSAPTPVAPAMNFDPLQKFKDTLVSIGGRVVELKNEAEISSRFEELFPGVAREGVIGPDTLTSARNSAHSFQNIELAILRGDFAVAENGAVWITDKVMIDRALPFICLNLALIVKKNSLVATMHQAYEKIGLGQYELGTFIAGPSKTADIEQSLVLGAHGAKTMTCFLVE